MTRFVLVHGVWHGAWCRAEQITALERLGQGATAVELPAGDPDAGAEYCVAVIAAVRRAGEDVVVGHSLAGLTIPLLPRLVPVRALAFLAALLPDPGRSWQEQLAADRPMTDRFSAGARAHLSIDHLARSWWPVGVASTCSITTVHNRRPSRRRPGCARGQRLRFAKPHR